MAEETDTDMILATVYVIDAAATARYMTTDHRGRPLPAPDFRFSMPTPSGGEVTFHRGATAEDVAAYCKREGWLP